MKKSVLNSIKIKENLIKFDKIDFGCDYLRLSFTKSIDKFDNLLFSIDSDNSNFGTITIDNHIFTYVRVITQNGLGLIFSTEFNGIVVPIFQYIKFNQYTRLKFHKSAKIDIYGAYFRLESIGEFSYRSIINYIKNISVEDPDITRYDYRIDYFSTNSEVSIPKIKDILGYVHSKSSIVEWKPGGKLTDWRVGNPDSGKYAIRYYDKKVDTNKKDKWFLYTDFLDYKAVHRLEIEFGRAFCRSFSLSQIDDLERKILGVLGIDGKIYDKSIFYQYNANSEITLENAGSFIKRFQNLGTKLYKAGYNPFTIIEKQLIDQFGPVVAHGLIEDFYSCYCLDELTRI